MGAYGAGSRSFLTDYDMSAVAADPDRVAFAREHDSLLDIIEKLAVTLFMMTFDSANLTEFGCNSRETFLFGFAGHTVVHICPLIVLSLGSVAKIIQSSGNVVSVEHLEPEFSVLFLVVGSFFKDSCDLLEAILTGFRGIVGILVASCDSPAKASRRFCSVLVPLMSFIFLWDYVSNISVTKVTILRFQFG